LLIFKTSHVEAYKNGDSDILAKIPTWVGERSEISNFLKEDISSLIAENNDELKPF